MKFHHFVATLSMGLSALACCAEDRLEPVYDAALAGVGLKAIALLSAVDASSLDAIESTRAACIRSALLAAPSRVEIPPISSDILLAYRIYWQQAMMRKVPVKDAAAELKHRLDAILAGWDPAYAVSTSLDVASERAKRAIERDGLFALTGVTPPYYELAIWKTQTRQDYQVALHDRRVETQVIFLDDFVSFGWAGFATCDRYHTGGWATTTALYAVKSAYDLKSEDFRVSYLAHESRHFSDRHRFPKLEAPELEYRAKLTELTLATESAQSLIKTFARRSGSERSSPHSFANYWVARHLSKDLFKSDVLIEEAARWDRIPAKALRRAAKRLLTSNDAALKNAKPSSLERFLPDSIDDGSASTITR